MPPAFLLEGIKVTSSQKVEEQIVFGRWTMGDSGQEKAKLEQMIFETLTLGKHQDRLS